MLGHGRWFKASPDNNNSLLRVDVTPKLSRCCLTARLNADAKEVASTSS
jgi:hypothetical protein